MNTQKNEPLLLTSGCMLYDNPIYAGMTIIYDYSDAIMIERDSGGFVWFGIIEHRWLVVAKAISFIKISSIITRKNATFAELFKEFVQGK